MPFLPYLHVPALMVRDCLIEFTEDSVHCVYDIVNARAIFLSLELVKRPSELRGSGPRRHSPGLPSPLRVRGLGRLLARRAGPLSLRR